MLHCYFIVSVLIVLVDLNAPHFIYCALIILAMYTWLPRLPLDLLDYF